MEEVKKIIKTNGKRNRTAGHDFERAVANILRALGFPHVVTSRSESRSRDNEKVDLINRNEIVNGRLPYNFSCKNSACYPRYSVLLKEMPVVDGVVNVVLHKFTIRKGNNFQPIGNYAILSMEDFMGMAKRIQELEKAKNDDSAY